MHDVKYQQEQSFLRGTFVPFLTNLIDDLGEIGTVFYIENESFENFNDFTQDNVVPECISPLL